MKNRMIVLLAVLTILALTFACSDDDSSGPGIGASIDGKTVRLNGGISELNAHALATLFSNSNGTVTAIYMFGYEQPVALTNVSDPSWNAIVAAGKISSESPCTFTGTVSCLYASGDTWYKYSTDAATITLASIGAVGGRVTGSFSATGVTMSTKPLGGTSWSVQSSNLSFTGGTIDVIRVTNNAITD